MDPVHLSRAVCSAFKFVLPPPTAVPAFEFKSFLLKLICFLLTDLIHYIDTRLLQLRLHSLVFELVGGRE